jgi:ATP synthase protein I
VRCPPSGLLAWAPLTMTDEKPPSRDDIDVKLRAARAEQAAQSGQANSPDDTRDGSGAGMAIGFRIAVELVAGIVVGTGIGIGLDSWLGTRPWLLIVFFLLGVAAGMLNVYRTVEGDGRWSGRKGGPGKTRR